MAGDPHATRSGSGARRGWRTPTRVLLILATVLVAWESYLLVSRARSGRSDIGVFLRSAALLNAGAGPEFYQARESNGWYHAVPPAALAIFQPLARLGPTGAGVGWALANLLLLLGALECLGRLFGTLVEEEEQGWRGIHAWRAILLMILAAGSIQVGQFSLLFLACWVLALNGIARGRLSLAGFALAVPVAIKIYPALLLAAPMIAGGRAARKVFAWFLVGLVAITIGLPSLTVGAEAAPMVWSWLQNGLFGAGGRVEGYLAGPGPVTTVSLQSLLARYLEGGSAYHARHAWVPHLDLAPSSVLALAGGACLAIVLLSGWATLRLHRARLPASSRLVHSFALWSATLYAVLPETKGRYAVYTFLAFIPLLDWTIRAWDARERGTFVRRGLLVLGCLLAVMGALPPIVMVLGLGYVGSLVLWGWNLRWVLAHSAVPGRYRAAEGHPALWPIIRSTRSRPDAQLPHPTLSPPGTSAP